MGWACEERRHLHRVGAVRAHPVGQRRQAAHDQPAVERRRHRAAVELRRAHLRERLVVAARDGDAAEHVAAAAEVLGGGVHRHVAAELERALQRRRGEGVVGDRARAGAMRDVGDGGDVDALDQRVRRRLDPDDPRRRLQRRGDVVEPRHVDEGRADLPLREQVLQHVGGAVVDVARRDDMVARLQALEDRRHRGEPRAERGARRRRLRARRARPRGRCGSGCGCASRRSRADSCRRRRARRSSRDGSASTTAPVAGSTPWPAWTASVSKRRGLAVFMWTRRYLPGAGAGRRRPSGSHASGRVVACRKVYLSLARRWKGVAVFHRASGFAIARGECLAAASPARTGLQPRNDAAAASAGLACAQSFPPKLLKPRRKLLPERRAAPTCPAGTVAPAGRSADLDWQRSAPRNRAKRDRQRRGERRWTTPTG